MSGNPEEGQSPLADSGQAQPVPAEGQSSSPLPGTETGPPAPPPRPKAPLFIAVVVAIVLIAGGVVAGVSLTSSSSGTGTPQGAVQALFTAAHKSDVLGALDVVDPDERQTLEPGLQKIWDQLKRLQILSGAADLSHVTGIGLQFPKLSYRTLALSSDVDEVTVTAVGGHVKGTGSPRQLPLGPVVKELVGPGLNQNSTSKNSPFGKVIFGTVKVNGNWYVSIGYSIAINALQSTGRNPAPAAPSQQLVPTGASSPTQVFQDIVSAAEHGDLKGIITQLVPGELGVADAYAPLWLDKGQAAFKSEIGIATKAIKKSRATVGPVNWDLVTKQVGLGTLVRFGPHFSFSAQAKGIKVSYANGCETETVGKKSTKVCSGRNLNSMLKYMPAPVRPILARLEASGSQMGLVMVQVDGRWYLSMVRTFYQFIVALLSGLKPTDFSTISDNLPGIENGFKQYEQSLLKSLGTTLPTTLPVQGLGPLSGLVAVRP